MLILRKQLFDINRREQGESIICIYLKMPEVLICNVIAQNVQSV